MKTYLNYPFIEKKHLSLGCPLHYWILDNTSDQWIFFLHGLGLDHLMYKEQVKALGSDYNLILWDIRGHGKSQPLGPEITVDILIKDLLAIMSKEDCHNAIFVGHSMGGYLAQEFSFRYPEKVSKLILIGSACITKKLNLWQKTALKLIPHLLKFVPWKLIIKASAKYSSEYQNVQEYITNSFSRINKRDYLRIIKLINAFFHYEEDYVIIQPVLLISGEDDKTINFKKEIDYWRTKERNYDFFILEENLHNCNQDNPDLINNMIQDFLNK
ncbi:Pimeloyl-ACP methyl ester carboxylesterase [Desulfonispora thiosulfatigenes DSM 11270]|uniref:Pimeloyl-ACP methyl ester carboxylesterase n=1 Tax=Desulfonispora thiosulfatigenes DSM 11270 TaxID=656914 RepID=A0A1W1VIZ8_DESTI|nr:alpha/beta hydrolase [Desulfonispora thiosulfatigenes]SMB92904.1 Pimeloyl-ACP methyl ester carboxylesterase [Desulfonispora thiosulfatigenes DSM 11270]